MSSRVNEIIAALDSFVPEDEPEDADKLYDILNNFRSCPDRELAMPAMFSLIERFPDSELGSPGPIVHELEAISGYDALLRESLSRQPSYMGVWMVDRILSSDLIPSDRERWLHALRATLVHSGITDRVRDAAIDSLESLGTSDA